MARSLRSKATLSVGSVAAAGMLVLGASVVTAGGASAATPPSVKASFANAQVIHDNFDTCGFTNLYTDTVNVPAAGFLSVTGMVGAARDTDNASDGDLTVRILVNGVVATNAASAILTTDGVASHTITVVGGVAVTQGAKTVALQAEECGSGMAYIYNESIETLYTKNGVVHGAPLSVSAKAALNN